MILERKEGFDLVVAKFATATKNGIVIVLPCSKLFSVGLLTLERTAICLTFIAI